MQILRRYMARQIYLHVGFVLLGFVGLFAFVDLVAEMRDLGRGAYGVLEIVTVIALRIPGMAYELMPVAALIGTVWALSQMAGASEFTVARASGMGPGLVLSTVGRIGIPLVVITLVLAELVLPVTETLALQTRAGALGRPGAGVLTSGYWLRDYPVNAEGRIVGHRIINLQAMAADRSLKGITVYQFSDDLRLQEVVRAKTAVFLETGEAGDRQYSDWTLQQATVQRIDPKAGSAQGETRATMILRSSLSPATLGALMVKPEQMSARELYLYVGYLKEGRQLSGRYEIAFWKKLIYPVAVWVMMILALPAAYLQARGGAVGLKVFLAIVAGVGFHLINSLFAHLGVLNTWPPAVVVSLPSALALVLGLIMLWRVQRHSL
jgi:lipopolysaccharide export system permease protein